MQESGFTFTTFQNPARRSQHILSWFANFDSSRTVAERPRPSNSTQPHSLRHRQPLPIYRRLTMADAQLNPAAAETRRRNGIFRSNLGHWRITKCWMKEVTPFLPSPYSSICPPPSSYRHQPRHRAHEPRIHHAWQLHISKLQPSQFPISRVSGYGRKEPCPTSARQYLYSRRSTPGLYKLNIIRAEC